MTIISIDPIYTEFGNGLYSTKNDSLEMVAKVVVDDYGIRESVVVKFDLHGDRKCMAWLAQHSDSDLVHRLNRNLEPKGPKSIARIALRGLEESRPQFTDLKHYLYFDKLTRKGA